MLLKKIMQSQTTALGALAVLTVLAPLSFFGFVFSGALLVMITLSQGKDLAIKAIGLMLAIAIGYGVVLSNIGIVIQIAVYMIPLAIASNILRTNNRFLLGALILAIMGIILYLIIDGLYHNELLEIIKVDIIKPILEASKGTDNYAKFKQLFTDKNAPSLIVSVFIGMYLTQLIMLALGRWWHKIVYS